MKAPRKLPPLELLEHTFKYDPHTGCVYKHGKLCNSWNRSGYNVIKVTKTRQIPASRLGWYLYYREDPGPSRHVVHINEDKSDNRIENLRLKQIASRAR